MGYSVDYRHRRVNAADYTVNMVGRCGGTSLPAGDELVLHD